MTQQPVTAALIKELRDRTGVGMGKCKAALEEAKGDIDLAIANLRKAGFASAVKKEGRTTNEGIIGFAEGPKALAIVEVNAETDFVVKNDRFQKFVEEIAQEAAKSAPQSLEEFLGQSYSMDNQNLTIDQYRAVLIQAIGENIQIKRLKIFLKAPNKSIGFYSHLGGKLLTVVEIDGSEEETPLAKDIAMHIAAAAPEYLSPEDVPADVIASEREIAQTQVQGKPANIIDKIVEGKINDFYNTGCLTNQKYIKDDQLTIAELVAKRAKESGKPLKLVSFARWGVGRG